ncbi:MAG: gliding motility-associated C-terminal domain-containing protein [Treponema sp.]|nr:gliding motility-associated C-terminal domain-containing protein [Candidatus Treponema caballi]
MNKARFVLCMLLVCCAAGVFAQTAKTLYISPNNDGVQDELVIPLRINEKRYVSEWSLVITDADGNPVRTIGNKEKRPEKMTIKTFFQQLFAKKEGVAVPESVMWNGILDTGETAPDGIYYYYVTASDDNGNTSKTAKFPITIDNTEPEIAIEQPSEAAKIFGAGNKETVLIKQSGSVEDLWTGTISDVNGEVIKTWTWKNSAPEDVAWDGKDELGTAVPEGVYSYKITSTDRAGNISEPVLVSNIIYDAIPRSVNLTVKGTPFSPNGDGIKDALDVQPVMTNSSGLVSWKIAVVSKAGATVRSWTGTTAAPADFTFDGKGTNGSVLADGDYQLQFTAQFNNGQECYISRNLTIDNTPPSALVRTDSAIFSPDGDGRLDTITFTQETSKEKNWYGAIYDEAGKVIKEYDFGELPPATVTWDGINAKGLIADGKYTYKLTATDLAGNSVTAETVAFSLDTGTTEVLFTASDKAFSPNNDKTKDVLVLSPQLKSKSNIAYYEMRILDASGKVVRTISDSKKALPSSFQWNGTDDAGDRCAEGMYTAQLFTRADNGNENTVTTQPFELDTIYPEVALSTPYLIFSPNGDGKKDTLPVAITATRENRWLCQITDAKGEVIRSETSEKPDQFLWDGTDENGNVVPDGTYAFKAETVDDAGNSALAEIKGIVVDTRAVKAYLTAEYDKFAPNGDGYRDSQTFSIMVTPSDGIESWSFAITSADGTKAREWSSRDSADVPSEIVWDGAASNGKPAEGTFTGNLTINYVKGDVLTTTTQPFVNSITPPQLTVRTAPEYFSPDNDGVDDDLYISLSGVDIVPFTQWSFEIKDPQNGSTFWKTSGKSAITERIIWDGRSNSGELVQSAMDYPYEFTVTDELGMTSTVSGIIPVDVLVIRVGDVLKMQIPSIIFRGDAADFCLVGETGPDGKITKNGITADQRDNNIRVLKRVAEILAKFRDYDVTIEGHANNVSGTEMEETQTTTMYGPALEPLSKERADYVKQVLVEYGIQADRLTTVGKGGREPVVAREDKDNWWKNRRVEFILNK